MSEFQPHEYSLDPTTLNMDLSSFEEHIRAEVEEKCTDLRIGIMEMLDRHGALVDMNGFAYYQFQPKVYDDAAMHEPGINDAFVHARTEVHGQPTQIVVVTNEMMRHNEERRKQGVITKEFVLSASNEVSLNTSSVLIDLENAVVDGSTEGFGSPLIIPIDRENVQLAFVKQACGDERITYPVGDETRKVYWQQLDSPYDSLDAIAYAEEVCRRTSKIEPWAASRPQ